MNPKGLVAFPQVHVRATKSEPKKISMGKFKLKPYTPSKLNIFW